MQDLISKLEGKTIGICGIGYIGKSLARYLRALSIDIHLVELSRQNYATVESYRYDYFINCAGNTGNFRNELEETVESNISLTIDLLKKIKISSAYVGLSSTRVYGFNADKNLDHVESMSSHDDHLSLDYIYDGSKKLMESLLVNMDKKLEHNVIVARLSNVYDDFSDDELDESTLLKLIYASAKNSKLFEIQQHETSSKDYIHIDDCLTGILRCAVYGIGGNVYNIARGKPTSLKEISNKVNPLIRFDNTKPPIHCSISIDKARTALAFKPSLNILELQT